MLPQFPEFKKVELSDQEEIERITNLHIPFSDFVFENIWSWDIQGKAMISTLNDNLVVVLEDIITGNPVCTFLGGKRVNDTLTKLFDYQEKYPEIISSIALVPEISLENIDLNKFYMEIDFDNSDYVYGIGVVAKFEGHKFYKKRKLYETFKEKYPDTELMVLDVSQNSVKEKIYELNEIWAGHKSSKGSNLADYRENEALHRLLQLNVDNLSTIGVLYKQRLIGYVINKILHGHYAIGLFGKFDRSFQGLNEFLMSSCAQELLKSECLFYNAGEDLGIQGLRMSKNSYMPITILRKYTIHKF